MFDTPEGMRREIDGEVRLRMHRPGLLPGMGRNAEMDQRVFDALTLRRDGLTYAEIGRRIGRCAQVVKHYCDWYGVVSQRTPVCPPHVFDEAYEPAESSRV